MIVTGESSGIWIEQSLLHYSGIHLEKQGTWYNFNKDCRMSVVQQGITRLQHKTSSTIGSKSKLDAANSVTIRLFENTEFKRGPNIVLSATICQFYIRQRLKLALVSIPRNA
jgi:hypothetical protein